MEVIHRELKQDCLSHLYQRTHESLLGTAKLSTLGKLLLEISAIRSMDAHLKIGKGTPGMRFRSMVLWILVDLFRAMEKGWKRVSGSIARIHGESIQVNNGFTERSNCKTIERYWNFALHNVNTLLLNSHNQK
ncbi:MAG: hypothetical protein AAE976_06805 [Thermoplasmataceae archaeon]|jgi:hypothetical protein|nr:MAG: hypothetical protein RE469_04560 [Cuniculiplasma divulgatum]